MSDLELDLLCGLLDQGGVGGIVPLFNKAYQQDKAYFRLAVEAGGPAEFIDNECTFVRLDASESKVNQVSVHVPFVVCREKQCTCNNLHVCFHWPSRVSKCRSCVTDLYQNPANGLVFKSYPLLQHLAPPHIKQLLKHSKFVIRPPTPILFEKCVSPIDLQKFPVVCEYYNSHSGCIKPSCVFFHLCKRHIDGKCSQGDNCRLSHDFESSHNQKIVKICGGIPMTPSSIIKVMKSQTSVTQLALDMLENGRSIHVTQTEICVWNLVGKCGYGTTCIFHHVNLPFWWQYQTDENTWESWDRDSILILEKAFCNPVIKTVEIKINDIIVIIDFPTMTFVDGEKHVRRLSTGPVHGARHLGSLATSYHWYWEEVDNVWHEFPSCVTQGKHCPQLELPSHVIERAYLAGNEKLNFKISDSNFVLLFGGMQMKERGCINMRKICRRPIHRTVPGCVGLVHAKDSPDHEYYTVVSDVSRESDEWRRVVSYLKSGRVPVEIKSIRSNLIDEQFQKGQKTKQTEYLFHPGVGMNNLQGVAHHGILLSNTPVEMQKYGQALHLARDESYALHFTDNSTVLLAEVAIGTYCKGKANDTKPPTSEFGEEYDCCVNDVTNPDVYVLYDVKCVNPKYCIRF